MPTPASSSAAHPAPPASNLATGTAALLPDILRLHAALTPSDLWHAARPLADPAIARTSVTFEIGGSEPTAPHRVFRHAHPATPADAAADHPARHWFALHPGTPAFRLSDITSLRELRGTPFFERVIKREGWDKQLGLVAWEGRQPVATINFYRAAGMPDFTPRELRLAETLQPHFQTAVRRVLAHESSTFLGDHFASILEDVPVGLLLLDWELRPLWFNSEGAHACAVWNHGERRAAALNPQRTFRVPDPLAKACADLRAQWTASTSEDRASGIKPRVMSEDALGLHARVALRALGNHPVSHPAFQVQLDYRRPRGDRNRPLSPGAVALLARLSGREREVAMRVREGLRTAEIAAELRRSPLTIKTQLAAIFTKLEVRSRTRVAALLNR